MVLFMQPALGVKKFTIFYGNFKIEVKINMSLCSSTRTYVMLRGEINFKAPS